MIDLKTSLLLVVTITNVVIGLVVLFRQRHQPASLAFVFFTIGISLWAMTNALFQLTTSVFLGTVFALASYYSGIVIALPLYSFTINFPKAQSVEKQRRLKYMLWIYGILLGIIISIPGLTLKSVVYDPIGRLITGPGLIFYGLSLAFFIFGGMFHLWKKRSSADKLEKRQISMILLGMLFAATFGMFFNLVLPLLGDYSLVWLGPDFTLILVGLMGYAIVRHNLFNIQLLATEIFTILLGLGLVVELISSKSKTEIFIRLLILITFLYLAHRLVSSVYEEVKAKDALQRLLEVKTDFISAASHQLRTPLTAIRGVLTMEYEGDYDTISDVERKALQGKLLQSVDRLTNIVNDLLRSAELENGLTGEFKSGQVEPLVQQSIDTLEPNFKKKQIQFNYQLPITPLPRVSMRSGFLQQVFLNLLDNAERYTPTGGQVTAKLFQQDQSVIFSVTDSGIGISPEDQKKIFMKFSRSEAAKAVQPVGTGLGLYIVKQIVEQHGGTITADSSGPGKGTTFTVVLPVA